VTDPSYDTTVSVAALDAAAVAELIAKQRLYENLVSYCRGQDRKDLELMKSTFWPEATDNHGMFVGSAHEFCQWAYEHQKTTGHRSHHYVTNVLSELDGDLARRESAVTYVMVRPDGGPTDIMGGRYRDLCQRRAGEWKVLRRVVIFDHVAQFTSPAQLGTVFGGIPGTARIGDVYPNDPTYEEEW